MMVSIWWVIVHQVCNGVVNLELVNVGGSVKKVNLVWRGMLDGVGNMQSNVPRSRNVVQG